VVVDTANVGGEPGHVVIAGGRDMAIEGRSCALLRVRRGDALD